MPSFDISIFDDLDAGQLEEVAKRASQALEEAKKADQQKLESRFTQEIKDWDQKIANVKSKEDEVAQEWDSKIDALKEQKANALSEFKSEVTAAYDEYNSWRESKGLSKVNVNNKSRKRSGKQYSYQVDIVTSGPNGENGTFAKYSIDDFDVVEYLNIASGAVPVKKVKHLFEACGIRDEKGNVPMGRVRGLVNKIKQHHAAWVKGESSSDPSDSAESAARMANA